MEASRLAGLEVFGGLDDADLERLAEASRTVSLPTGSVLADQGDLATKFFVLLSGHVTVHRDGRHLADLGPGDFVGEMGVVSKVARNATVIATTPVEAAVVTAWDTRGLLNEFPALAERVQSIIDSRSTG